MHASPYLPQSEVAPPPVALYPRTCHVTLRRIVGVLIVNAAAHCIMIVILCCLAYNLLLSVVMTMGPPSELENLTLLPTCVRLGKPSLVMGGQRLYDVLVYI